MEAKYNAVPLPFSPPGTDGVGPSGRANGYPAPALPGLRGAQYNGARVIVFIASKRRNPA